MLKFFSWTWVIGKIVEWAASNLTEEMIKEWVDDLKLKVIPWIRTKGEELITKLEEKAADTTTPIDDVAVKAFKILFDVLMPDKPDTL